MGMDVLAVFEMRRVKTFLITDLEHSSGWKQGVSGIDNADLRLMLAVVREVDLYDKQRSSMADIRNALDAFNKPRKQK